MSDDRELRSVTGAQSRFHSSPATYGCRMSSGMLNPAPPKFAGTLGAYVRRALIGRQNWALDERTGTEKRESPRQVWPSPASPNPIIPPCPSMVRRCGATHINSSFGDPSLLRVIHTPKISEIGNRPLCVCFRVLSVSVFEERKKEGTEKERGDEGWRDS